MKKYLMLMLCALLSQMAVAQSGRFVNGVVYDENDSPKAGVKVLAKGSSEETITGPDGQFQLLVSPYTKYLEAQAEGYLTQSAEIDGSYIVFRMKINKKYAEQKAAAEKAAAEAAAAKAKAEEQARIEAEKKAAAEAKAEEQERLAAEKAAAAKAKAEELARIEAEKKAAAEAAKAKAKEQQVAPVPSDIETKRLSDNTPTKKSPKVTKSKTTRGVTGLINKVELNYSIGLGATEDVIFQNYGYKQFNSPNPVEGRYYIGYRFNNYFSLSAGVGFLYETQSLATVGDIIDEDIYGSNVNYEYNNFSVPVLLNTDIFLTKSKCQPMLSFSGGIYLSSPLSDMSRGLTYLADGGIGCNYRFNEKRSVYVLASAGLIPQHRFFGGVYMRVSQASVRIKVGFIL